LTKENKKLISPYFSISFIYQKRGKKPVFLLTKENKKLISPYFSISFIDKNKG